MKNPTRRINTTRFPYQLSEWVENWVELCGMIYQLDNDGSRYGNGYIVKKDGNKNDCRWAVFTKGRNVSDEVPVVNPTSKVNDDMVV